MIGSACVSIKYKLISLSLVTKNLGKSNSIKGKITNNNKFWDKKDPEDEIAPEHVEAIKDLSDYYEEQTIAHIRLDMVQRLLKQDLMFIDKVPDPQKKGLVINKIRELAGEFQQKLKGELEKLGDTKLMDASEEQQDSIKHYSRAMHFLLRWCVRQCEGSPEESVDHPSRDMWVKFNADNVKAGREPLFQLMGCSVYDFYRSLTISIFSLATGLDSANVILQNHYLFCEGQRDSLESGKLPCKILTVMKIILNEMKKLGGAYNKPGSQDKFMKILEWRVSKGDYRDIGLLWADNQPDIVADALKWSESKGAEKVTPETVRYCRRQGFSLRTTKPDLANSVLFWCSLQEDLLARLHGHLYVEFSVKKGLLRINSFYHKPLLELRKHDLGEDHFKTTVKVYSKMVQGFLRDMIEKGDVEEAIDVLTFFSQPDILAVLPLEAREKMIAVSAEFIDRINAESEQGGTGSTVEQETVEQERLHDLLLRLAAPVSVLAAVG